MPLDSDRIKQELNPHPNTDGYVLVVQVGEHQWYRTPDILPDYFWAGLPGSIGLLGKATPLGTEETQLVLPALSKRRLTLLYPDGRPKANTPLAVSLYLWNGNHCGFHLGLPLGIVRTDAGGAFEVQSQLIPLYLDIEYLEEAGHGPAGLAYSANFGLKTGSSQSVVLRKVWEFPRDCCRAAKLRVLTRSNHSCVPVQLEMEEAFSQ